MGLRSGDRRLSFDILGISEDDEVMPTTSADSLLRSKSDPTDSCPSRKKKKKRRKNRRGNSVQDTFVVTENSIPETSEINGDVSYSCTVSTVTEVAMVPDVDSEGNCAVRKHLGELRQRNVGNAMNGVSEETVSEESGNNEKNETAKEEMAEDRSAGNEINSENQVEFNGRKLEKHVELNGRKLEKQVELNGRKLEKEESLDWKKLMAEDPNYTFPVEKSPMRYFMEEMYAGNSLRSTTTIGNDKERERIYDTIFRLPWRCELLINFGFFVCFDSFLSLLTIMPTRIIMTFWRLLRTRQFKRPSAAELSDFGCFIILACGVALLQQADISLIYHMIRGQGIIKLYVVYNVLEVFDKLNQSFGGDVMQSLFNSADGLANSSPENMQYWLWRFILDEALAIASSIVHSFILLAQAITLSVCIVAHNNALFAMLVSNNFAEIKSNVFKRYSRDNVHSLVYYDSVERFHITAFILFVLAQNILEAEGPWFASFLCNAMVVFICEVMIDIVKHSFIAKFNDIKPITFSEFLEDLCKQTLNIQSENGKTGLTFVPLAPACVVIRVLRPVYAAHLPYSPLPWRLFWMLILTTMTFVMLASLKVMIGMGLRKHARWYLKRCERRKLHSD